MANKNTLQARLASAKQKITKAQVDVDYLQQRLGIEPGQQPATSARVPEPEVATNEKARAPVTPAWKPQSEAEQQAAAKAILAIPEVQRQLEEMNLVCVVSKNGERVCGPVAVDPEDD